MLLLTVKAGCGSLRSRSGDASVGSTLNSYIIGAPMVTWIADVEEGMVVRVDAATAITCSSILKSISGGMSLALIVGTRCNSLKFQNTTARRRKGNLNSP